MKDRIEKNAKQRERYHNDPIFRAKKNKYSREWDKRKRQECGTDYRRLKALKMISPELMCSYCGCTELKILEINHKNGGGNKERAKYKGSSVGIFRSICSGKRSTEDLELRCRVCNILHYVQDILGIKGHKVIYEPNIISTNI